MMTTTTPATSPFAKARAAYVQEVHELCALAGASEAAANSFVEAGMPIDAVKGMLLAGRPQGAPLDHGWSEAAAKANARAGLKAPG